MIRNGIDRLHSQPVCPGCWYEDAMGLVVCRGACVTSQRGDPAAHVGSTLAEAKLALFILLRITRQEQQVRMLTRLVYLSGSREPFQTVVPAGSHASAPSRIATRYSWSGKRKTKTRRYACLSVDSVVKAPKLLCSEKSEE